MANCCLAGREPPSLASDRLLRGGLALVEVGEAARVGLITLGELVLLTGVGVAAPGDDAGIAGALVGQAGDIVAGRQLRFQIQGRGEGVGGEAVADVAAEPDGSAVAAVMRVRTLWLGRV